MLPYFRHFPEILKSHSSHDVVLLCASCHKKSGVFDQQYKTYFAQLCDAPYKSGGVMIDSDLKKVKSAARSAFTLLTQCSTTTQFLAIYS